MTDIDNKEQTYCSENTNTVTEYIQPRLPVYRRIDTRRMEWGGLVPAPTPQMTSRYTWHISYLRQLMDMYKIVSNVISARYPTTKIKWKTQQHFNDFSILVYGCSSKYISPHLEEPPELDYDLNCCESDDEDEDEEVVDDGNGKWETV